MDVLTLFVALFCVVVFLWYRRHDHRLPPSPMTPLPLIGHLAYMASDYRPLFKKWRKQSGDIYSLYMGGSLVVVLNGFDVIREALIKKGDAFSDRPPMFIDKVVEMEDTGVILSNGNNWKEQRTVTLSILRSFGMGKDLLAQKIQEEVSFYTGYFSSLRGKPTDIRLQTNISTCNITLSILTGNRFEYHDKELKNLVEALCRLAKELNNVSIANFFPWLAYLPGDLFRVKCIASCVTTIKDMLSRFLDEKKRHVEDASEVSNLVDAYIVERNKKIKAGIPTYLDDKNLLKVMIDLFDAGTETTSTTIYWCVLYMINYPEIQEKVYQEIKDKVGIDRIPTMQDKVHLIYLNAVIMETQRHASIVPLSVSHMCSQDVDLRGSTIPKGTLIIPSLDSVLHDENTWGDDVMIFKPERFIDATGKLNIPEYFIPFSIGRRMCLGEGIAKMELFLFLSNMFQRFKFLPPSEDHVPNLDYDCGVIISPKPYEVRLVERN